MVITGVVAPPLLPDPLAAETLGSEAGEPDTAGVDGGLLSVTLGDADADADAEPDAEPEATPGDVAPPAEPATGAEDVADTETGLLVVALAAAASLPAELTDTPAVEALAAGVAGVAGVVAVGLPSAAGFIGAAENMAAAPG
ncbi:hypothetical protein M6D93_05245 [Jatrophihabitans telluris]|uniref:Uncharacterized protein n=1 Tax=Jatrophihabitans telluris TaxID=2038343 RepID=A0ABY4R0J1_9ACTN|nr:hypothetical protein [Jatrophihabitans telluris]UQX89411.1 hypothetical protein M6D93_05245 [Jatrophihabitans telluris]